MQIASLFGCYPIWVWTCLFSAPVVSESFCVAPCFVFLEGAGPVGWGGEPWLAICSPENSGAIHPLSIAHSFQDSVTRLDWWCFTLTKVQCKINWAYHQWTICRELVQKAPKLLVFLRWKSRDKIKVLILEHKITTTIKTCILRVLFSWARVQLKAFTDGGEQY